MNIINVVRTVGAKELLAQELGDRLYKEIHEGLRASDSIEVDFTGCTVISTIFLNRSLGQITMDFDLDQKKFEARIGLKGLDEDDLDDVKLCVRNAIMRKKLLDKKIDLNQYYTMHLAH